MRKILTLSFILLLLTGCATVPKTVTPENINAIKRVAVVSLLGDEIHFRKIGTTVFTNVDKKFSVQEWGIDQHIENLVKNEFKNNKSIQLVEINFDKEKLKDIYKSTNRIPYADYDLKYVDKYLHDVATSEQVDALILIAETSIEIPNTPQYVRGYALYNRTFLFLKFITKIYLVSAIEVVDLQTLKPFARQSLFFAEKVDNSYWQEDIAKLNADQISFIKNTIINKLNDKVPLAIKTFNLSK